MVEGLRPVRHAELWTPARSPAEDATALPMDAAAPPASSEAALPRVAAGLTWRRAMLVLTPSENGFYFY